MPETLHLEQRSVLSRLRGVWKTEPLSIPDLPHELNDIMVINQLCGRIEEDVREARTDDANTGMEQLKGLIAQTIARKEATKTVSHHERTQLERQLNDYLIPLRGGTINPALRDELLRGAYQFIHDDPAFTILGTSHLVDQISSRQQVEQVLNSRNAQLETKYQRTLLTLAFLFILAGITTWYLYNSKKSLQQQLSSQQKKDEQLANQQATIADLQSQVSILPARQQQIQTLEEQVNRLQSTNAILLASAHAKGAELEQAQNRIQALVQQNQQLTQQVQRLQPGPPITPAEIQRAQELREMAKNGKPLSENQIDLIRKVSEFMIGQWKEEANEAIRRLREAAEQAIQAGGNAVSIQNETSLKVVQIQQALDVKIVNEVNEVDALIVSARNERQ